MYIYICIYIEREREGERDKHHISLSIYIYMYDVILQYVTIFYHNSTLRYINTYCLALIVCTYSIGHRRLLPAARPVPLGRLSRPAHPLVPVRRLHAHLPGPSVFSLLLIICIIIIIIIVVIRIIVILLL